MGGAWERLIQIVKKILKEMLQTKYPQENVLRTEIQNIVNSRPLTHISLDTSDTPNHFLIGPSYSAMSCVDLGKENFKLLPKWKAAQKLADIFWKRWTYEYLTYLTKRSKWQQETPSIRKNDGVLIVDPNGLRNNLLKGRVSNLYPAKDNRIRIVDVQLANGVILRRPVSRLCVLDVKRT
ncbi:uncharacterized protein [Leptinotarsa decemlineata]|uniref:uncharacterized protein n=1 Tax=Leptinotarsa decemlineata TaxID=7539 RepID=UPI003D30B109